MKKLNQHDLQSLFDLAGTYWLAKNWDEAMAAEMKVQKILAEHEEFFPLWRDLIDYLEVFYRENGRGMIVDEAIVWLAQAGMSEIMSNSESSP